MCVVATLFAQSPRIKRNATVAGTRQPHEDIADLGSTRHRGTKGDDSTIAASIMSVACPLFGSIETGSTLASDL